MFKKVIGILVTLCIAFLSVFEGSVRQISASSSTQLDPDELLSVLNNITVAGQAWENIGFDPVDIADILQMQRKSDSYYSNLRIDNEEMFTQKMRKTALETLPVEQKQSFIEASGMIVGGEATHV